MSVQVSTLDNGLRVATDRVAGVETVSLGVWVGVGTRNETAELNGVAHLLEHMAFKGTAKRSAYDISREIEAVGGQLNAYTGRENTAFYVKVLAGDLPLALDIIADIVQHPSFDEEELSRERAVVLQELGQAHDTPDDIIFDHFQETAFPEQAIGRPVLGRPEIVAAMPRQALADYLDRNYRSGSLVVVGAGRLEHEDFVRRVEEAFGDLRLGTAKSDGETAQYHGGEYRESRELEQVHLVMGFPGVAVHREEFYSVSVLSTLLGGGMSSRLFQELREKRGLVYSVYSFHSAFVDAGLFSIYAGTGDKEAAELIPVIFEELHGLTQAIESEELSRARAQLKAAILMSRESTSQRCEQLAQQLLIYGRPLSVEEIVTKIEAVDEARVNALAQSLLKGPLTLAAIGPLGHLESYDRMRERLA